MDYRLTFNAELDEGLTKTDKDLTNESIVLPETNLQRENRCDVRSDIACIAGILYFCLTRQAPKHIGTC